MRQTRKAAAGFSLIELLIVVSIIAILAAVAFPSYQESVAKSRRSDAQAALQGFAQAMERFYTDNGTYCDAGGAGGASSCGTATNDTGTPSIFSPKSPLDGANTYYDLTINAADATSYTLFATPVNAQAGDGILGLRSTGRRGWDKDADNNPFEAGETCWKKTCN